MKVGFYKALKEINDGKKVTKLEWNSEGFYGILQEGMLQIHKPDGTTHPWIISEGDLMGKDYDSIK